MNLLGLLQTVGEGKITGGWEFVWAAYGLTWVALTLYGAYLWRRSRAVKPNGTFEGEAR